MDYDLSVIEFIWIFLSMLSLILGIYGYADAYEDKKIARESTDPDVYLLANGLFRREVIRIIVQSLFLVTGIAAALLPSFPLNNTQAVIMGVIATAMISAQALICFNVIADRKLRLRILFRSRMKAAARELEDYDNTH